VKSSKKHWGVAWTARIARGAIAMGTATAAVSLLVGLPAGGSPITPAEWRSQPAAATLAIAEHGADAAVAATQAPAPSPYLHVKGSQFELDGKPFRLIGINAPQLATYYPVNGGCGAQVDPLTFFNELPLDTTVRVGFQQDAIVNAQTGQWDWRGLDRVVDAAQASPKHPLLIVSLASQGGTCDANVWKSAAWYQGGYMQPANDYDHLPRQSYWNFMTAVVTRYKSSTAIAMWEPVGEPEADTCDAGLVGGQCYGHNVCPPNASQILRQFFDTVGGQIHKLDPNHLVGDGALGGGQCGWTGTGPAVIDASPAINAVSYHDYWATTAGPLPAELAGRIALAKSVAKPVFDGEVGMDAGTAAGCASLSQRATEMQAKLTAGVNAGLAGFLMWAYGGPAQVRTACDDYIMDNDPSLALVARNAGSMWP
jgi:hypothetical protein